MRGDDGGRRFSAAGRAKLSTSGSTSAPAPSTPTPYPPKARLPSLSSTASCVSIETPAGAMAQPVAPLSRKISPSTVGRLARATDPPAEDPFDACLGHSIPSEQLGDPVTGERDVGRVIAPRPDPTSGHHNGNRLQWVVELLRSREVSWAQIGGALGISRQSAWERFT